MLEVKQIWKTFNAGTVNEKQALRGISLTLNDGDFCTVIGGNGAGKSTLLNAVAGTFPVDAGSISLGGVDVTNRSLEEAGIRIHTIPSAELSRGRGGPRCMSMPLWREDP